MINSYQSWILAVKQTVLHKWYLYRNIRKRILEILRPAKTQTMLHICAVWSETSLAAWRHFASLVIQYAPSEDSDQTARCAGWSESSLDARIRRYVFAHCGSYFIVLLAWNASGDQSSIHYIRSFSIYTMKYSLQVQTNPWHNWAYKEAHLGLSRSFACC